MEEKKKSVISLVLLVLILIFIAIIVLTVFIVKGYWPNEEKAENNVNTISSNS